MSTENSGTFTKENLDLYLKELSREYKKLGGRNYPVEIILVGGAAVIESYGFREMTTDIDAVWNAVSILKEAVNRVGDRFGLPNGWMNADFMKTPSYTQRLSLYSVPYKTFNQVLHVRTVTGEYLIAMKLLAGRKYKNDLSDIVGILAEQEATGKPVSYEMIDNAVKNLYGGWESIPQDSVSFIQGILDAGNYKEVYEQIRESEVRAQEILLDFQKANPGDLREEDVSNILEEQVKQEKSSVLVQLKGMKERT
ncbi:MAG: DUF6036 family nucleotidyltransferase [Lachnospiraceae bacterium]|nr:DUF6036 family nucleotidyltransferase [Lachnospiraceae bacterium]